MTDRVIIDCTNTYSSRLNTGIQRVVRNLVNHAQIIGNGMGIECIPAILDKDEYVCVIEINYTLKKRTEFQLRAFLSNQYFKMGNFIASMLPFLPLRKFFTATKHEFGLAKIFLWILSPIIWLWNIFNRLSKPSQPRPPIINPQKGDILLLADSTWNYNPWFAVEKAKLSGAIVIAIIYDIIPIYYPQFYVDDLHYNFKRCLSIMNSHVDGFLCISDCTRREIYNYYQLHDHVSKYKQKSFDYFQLGAELDAIKSTIRVRNKIKNIFKRSNIIYLTVGTIEPRKNHVYLLNVFDLLWQEGSKSGLLIVGRAGWLCKDIIARIKRNSMYGKQLFFFNDASDTELDYCYSHSKALLLPSVMEGFGLPLIEAQKKGLDVFASDIPIFKEVAGESAAYFDNTDPHSLVSMIVEYERTGIFPADGHHGFTWPTWAESTSQMFTKLLQMADYIQSKAPTDDLL